MLFILPGSLHLRSFPCLELSIIKTKIIIVPEAYDILVLLHISSLSVRHRERCLLHTSMTNINISYKYSNASHTSLWLDFFFTCCKENWENTKTGHRYAILTCSLSIKVSCEPSRSQISLFPLSHYLPPPNHITCSHVLRIGRSHLKWCHLHRNPTILEWYHLLQPKCSFFSQIS